jgi:5-methylcytosine-specific restriction enzyme A
MNLRPLKPCPGAGPRRGCCPNIAPRGQRYCATCQVYIKAQQRTYDKERDKTDSRRFLHSRTWRKIRDAKLARDPLCERCLQKGMDVAAFVVHHKDRNELNNRPENLESLCNACHETEHKGERWGSSVDSYPI